MPVPSSNPKGSSIARTPSIDPVGAEAGPLVPRASLPSKRPPIEAPLRRSTQLRRLLERPGLDFLLEAHSGLSAKLVEEAGFPAIWASGLSISASLGLRDSNEASWTQVLDVLEYMADSARIPVLVDGDTGYGNFNNARRLVQKLEQRRLAGVCIEDKLFPKTNSFLNGRRQPLAEIDEFCGRLRAAKDAQQDEDFVVVARIEAFIAGWGLDEALRRAEAYHAAGADAILIHSALRTAEEVLAFRAEWGERSPVVIVPTKYYTTPTAVLEEAGFSAAIWANHLMRASLATMQATARRLAEERSAVEVEERIAPLAEVFRLQGVAELEDAERRYLPQRASDAHVIVLGSARGSDMPELTATRPKCMVEVGGQPILRRILDTYRAAGFSDLSVVRGYKKEAVDVGGVAFHDNDEPATTHEAFALACARPALQGTCVISYGDVLFRKFIPRELVDLEDDFAVFVDSSWHESRNRTRYADYVVCSEPLSRKTVFNHVYLVDVSNELDAARIHGEWMGFLKVSARGAEILSELLARVAAEPEAKRSMDMAGLMRRLLSEGQKIRVLYTAGNWLDIDTVADALEGGSFQ